MKKRSVAALLFIIAIILSVFSFSVNKYVESSNEKGQTIEQSLQGKVRLEILPQEDNMLIANVGNAGER